VTTCSAIATTKTALNQVACNAIARAHPPCLHSSMYNSARDRVDGVGGADDCCVARTAAVELDDIQISRDFARTRAAVDSLLFTYAARDNTQP
jgi:hypothetical protein